MSDRIERLELGQLPAELRVALEPRVERLGYLGEFFRCAAHQPEALRSFMAFTDDLKDALPDELTEVVALTVAATTGNDYERHQHERLCLHLGFAAGWVRQALACEPSRSDGLGEAARAVQELTLALLADRGRGVTEQLDRVIDEVGVASAVAVLLLVGRYLTHALVANALELAPPVASPLAERV